MSDEDIRVWRIRQLAVMGKPQPKWDTLTEAERSWWRQQHKAWLDRGAPPFED